MTEKRERYKKISGGAVILFFATAMIYAVLLGAPIIKFASQAALLIAIVSGVLYWKETHDHEK